jgi:hypothetical protein
VVELRGERAALVSSVSRMIVENDVRQMTADICSATATRPFSEDLERDRIDAQSPPP